MPNVSFGGTSSLSGFTENYVASSGVAIASGRETDSGQNPIRVTSIAGYASGRGAARACTMKLGSVSTAAFTIASSSSAKSTGAKTISAYFANGGTATFTLDFGGSSYFGRGGSGTAVDSFGTSFSGRLGGSYTYAQAPTAPRSPVVSRDSASATLTWLAPTDNGGSVVTGYVIQYSTSPSFTSPSTYTSPGTGLTATVTGLTPGTTYYFRVGAVNAVTSRYSTSSVYSATATVPPGGSRGEVWNGTAWVVSETVEVWNGTAWVTASTVEVWSGTAWVPSL